MKFAGAGLVLFAFGFSLDGEAGHDIFAGLPLRDLALFDIGADRIHVLGIIFLRNMGFLIPTRS